MLAAVVPDDVIGITYFVGSLFFTTASVLVAATTWRDIAARARSSSTVRAVLESVDWWVAMIQVAGTLWFNVNTYNAMLDGLTTQEQNLRGDPSSASSGPSGSAHAPRAQQAPSSLR